MALEDPTSDSGQFGSNELWQIDDTNPFGSLIELAYKLNKVNREFNKRFWNSYESSTKVQQSLCLSNVVELGYKYDDVLRGADLVLPRLFTNRNSSDDHFSLLMGDHFGSKSKKKPKFLSERKKRSTVVGKKYKTSSAKSAVSAARRAVTDNSSDETFLVRQSVDVGDKSTRKSARIESLQQDPRQKHNCPLCSYQTDNRCHLRRHLSSVHNAAKAYYCYICKKEFSRSERVKAHFLNIHPEISYHPKIVRKEFYLLDEHLDSIMTEGTFDDLAATSVPMETVEDPLPMKRADSENELSAQKSWERYCQISTQPFDGQRIFTCRQCSFGGGDIWLMKKHYLDVHLGATTYVCRICRYTSSCVTRLVSHMLGHGELICSYCSYSTSEVKLFEKHLNECNLHIRCSICELEFADKGQLQAHTLAEHHLYSCTECPFTSSSSLELDAHVEAHVASNSSLIQEIESDDEVLLGPYRSRAEAVDSGTLSALSKRQSSVSTEVYLGMAGTSAADDASAIEQNWNRLDEKVLDKVLAKVNNGNIFSCLVPGCGFRASWKKSLELHSENYHSLNFYNSTNDLSNVLPGEKNARCQNTVECLASGFFPCPFCPNCRTFKYRKSFEKHLSQHGLDHEKYPFLIARLNRKGE